MGDVQRYCLARSNDEMLAFEGSEKCRAAWMEDAPNGAYVLASDYDALKSQLDSTIRTDNSRVIDELQRLADQRNATIGRMGQEMEALKQAATDFLNASQALDDNYNDTQGAVAPKEMGDVYSNAKDRLKRALGFYAMPKGGE